MPVLNNFLYCPYRFKFWSCLQFWRLLYRFSVNLHTHVCTECKIFTHCNSLSKRKLKERHKIWKKQRYIENETCNAIFSSCPFIFQSSTKGDDDEMTLKCCLLSYKVTINKECKNKFFFVKDVHSQQNIPSPCPFFSPSLLEISFLRCGRSLWMVIWLKLAHYLLKSILLLFF